MNNNKNSRLCHYLYNLKFNLSKALHVLIILLAIGISNSYSNPLNSQTKIDLVIKDASLIEFFEEVQSITKINFLYKNDVLKDEIKISVNLEKASIEKVLNEAFSNTNLDYKIANKEIIVYSLNNRFNDSTVLNSKVDQEFITVTGTVTEDETGMPIPSANILEKGTSNGVMTDFDGNYSINLPKDAILSVSYLGYATKEIKVDGRNEIDVVLQQDAAALDEVVVVGFGSQKKANVSGAVSSVDLEDALGDRPITNSLSALQGTIPGLQVTLGSGEPGSQREGFNIRGVTSINGGSPLVLVNNVPVSIEDVNPRDIKTVTVLKDASATSIYGARAAFGVILITTKKPEIGKPKFSYSLTSSVSRPTGLPEMASPLEFVTALNDWGRVDYWSLGQDPSVWKGLLEEYNSNPSTYPLGYTEVDNIRYQLENNNPIDDLFGDLGFTQIHNASMSGGSEIANYRVSLGYTDEDGILVTNKDGFKRYHLNSLTSVKITPKLTSDLNVFYSNANRSIANQDYSRAVRVPSFAPVGNHDNGDGNLIPYSTPENLVKLNPANSNINSNLRLFSKIEYNPFKDLTLTGEYTFETKARELTRVNTDPETFSPTVLTIDPNNNDETFYRNDRGKSKYKGLNLYATYSKSLGKHNIKLLTGYNSETYSSSELFASRRNLISYGLPSLDGATGEIRAGDGFGEWAVNGVFGRINYNYEEKYFLEANGRYDGSSRFAEGNRYGFFPSFSAAWNIAKESFMQKQDLFSVLKLRGSWGEIGNQETPGLYPAVPGLPLNNAFWLTPGDIQHVTLGDPGLISSAFTWETVQTTNFGLDIAILNNRLNVSAEIYSRKTLNMITQGEELPAILGAPAPVANAADLETKGWELDFNWQDNVGKDFYYQIGVNIFDSQSEITNFGNEEGLIDQFYVGRKFGEIWGYVTDGFYTVDDFETGTLNDDLTGGTLKEGIPNVRGRNPNPGDIKYKDLDGDGEIFTGNNTLEDSGDRKIIGNNTRRYNYGANITMGYKNFDFSMFLNGVGKRDIVLNNDLFWPFREKFDNIFKHHLDYWTPENTSAYYPRIYETDGSNYSASRSTQTKYLLDGSYLAIKNITIGYTFSDQILDKLNIGNLRVFLSAENLLFADQLPQGLNPELQDRARGAAYPFQRNFAIGLNLNF